MNSKAIYWIALGAFALGLNSEYRNGSLPVLHRVADRAGSMFCRIASQAEQTLAMARILTSRPQPELRVDEEFMARQQAEMNRVMAEQQANLDRVLAERQAELNRAMALREADLARAQAQLDRMQAVLERTRLTRERALEHTRLKLANATNRRISVVCPGTKLSVRVPADLNDMNIELPEVEVGDSF